MYAGGEICGYEKQIRGSTYKCLIFVHVIPYFLACDAQSWIDFLVKHNLLMKHLMLYMCIVLFYVLFNAVNNDAGSKCSSTRST